MRSEKLLSDFIRHSVEASPDAPALRFADRSLDYGELHTQVEAFASGLMELGLGRLERVGVFLPKQIETAVSIFGTAAAGCTFVPVNPVLKARQVQYICADCDVRVLVTSAKRFSSLLPLLGELPSLSHVVLVDEPRSPPEMPPAVKLHRWDDLLSASTGRRHGLLDSDMTSILYTSGSTGSPKGVVLSHRNMVCGAQSVSTYLGNTAEDRLLAILPLSFDYGLSQLTTAFRVGASCVLMDYLLPADVLPVMAEHGVTGCAAVPSLWTRIAMLEWPQAAVDSLRYITNSGGAMPRTTTAALRRTLPNTRIFLMYGLTEAFRSTYLDPALVDERPESIGKAIPYAEVVVARPDGTLCEPNEPGELVHRGPLVSMGYWNDPEKTAIRFRPAPGQPKEIVCKELAVWSGDQVRMDEEGFLYFESRQDEMIKTSGYRVSPTEVEEVVYGSGLAAEVVALGVPHKELGQAIVIVVVAKPGGAAEAALLKHCRRELPNYMVPAAILWREEMPRNPNGKLDRKTLASECREMFADC